MTIAIACLPRVSVENSMLNAIACLRKTRDCNCHGFLKIQVSFAEYSLFYRALLQKRPMWKNSMCHATARRAQLMTIASACLPRRIHMRAQARERAQLCCTFHL